MIDCWDASHNFDPTNKIFRLQKQTALLFIWVMLQNLLQLASLDYVLSLDSHGFVADLSMG